MHLQHKHPVCELTSAICCSLYNLQNIVEFQMCNICLQNFFLCSLRSIVSYRIYFFRLEYVNYFIKFGIFYQTINNIDIEWFVKISCSSFIKHVINKCDIGVNLETLSNIIYGVDIFLLFCFVLLYGLKYHFAWPSKENLIQLGMNEVVRNTFDYFYLSTIQQTLL